MVIHRRTTPSPHVKQFRRDFDKIVTASVSKSARTPLQLLVISSYLNRLHFIEHVNHHLSWDESRWKYSPGILAQLLVLIPFIPSRRRIAISRISDIYQGMDLELLTGAQVDSADLNDDLFGRLLDRIYECGCEALFYEIAMTVRMALNLPENYVLHSDTTSHVLYGDYSQNEKDDEPALRITYGYSKDKRKDLKQIMTGMVTDGDGLIVYSQTLDGNTADSDYNHQMIKTLHLVYGSDFKKYVYIADSKLLNGPNIQELLRGDHPIPFISRIPQNFHKKLCEKVKTKAYEQNQWIDLGPCCNHSPGKDTPSYECCMIPVKIQGNDMYAHVYRSTDKRAKVERRVDSEREKLISEVTKLCRREFFCEADALAEMNLFLTSHSSMLVSVELRVISEVSLKRGRGRPGKNTKTPEEIIRWTIVSHGISRKEDLITHEVEKASTFCLLTNISPNEKSGKEILLLYKGQSHVERQFSLLKEPLVAATIFLESPERIKALMTILYFSVLMHGILRVISHIELEKEQTPPRFGVENRPLIRPTSDSLMWILDIFSVVSQKGSILIESKASERAGDLPLILKLVRFDPEFL